MSDYLFATIIATWMVVQLTFAVRVDFVNSMTSALA